MPSIIFVCTANQIRSPIAAATFVEAVQAKPATRGWKVTSAGTWTKSGLAVMPKALQLAKMLGIDLSTHRTTAVEAAGLEAYDRVVVMQQGHCEAIGAEFPEIKPKLHLLTTLAGEVASDIPDPVALDLPEALQVLVEMQALVRSIYERLSGGNR